MYYTCKIEKNYSRAACELAAFARFPERAPLAFPAPAAAAPIANSYASNWWKPAIAGEPFVDRVPSWLARALERSARRWLRAQRAPWKVEVVGITTDGTTVIHVYATARRAQRRMASLAPGLAKVMTRTARASNMLAELGTGRLVLSWGWSPRVLADDARRKVESARPAAAPKSAPATPSMPSILLPRRFGAQILMPA